MGHGSVDAAGNVKAEGSQGSWESRLAAASEETLKPQCADDLDSFCFTLGLLQLLNYCTACICSCRATGTWEVACDVKAS